MIEKVRSVGNTKRRIGIGVTAVIVLAGVGCRSWQEEPTVPEPKSKPLVIAGDGYILEQGRIGSNRITVYTRKDSEEVMEESLGALKESHCDVIAKFPRGSASGKDGQYTVTDLFVVPNNTCMDNF